MNPFALAVIVLLLIPKQEEPVKPYIDPAQLDCPFPKHSHLKQPWRGWLETRRAEDFLAGVGINYNVPSNDALAIRLLSEAGFRAVRKEIGWGSLTWDESGVSDEPRIREQLRLFKKYGLRPTYLLNCHQGAPCPVRFFEGTLLEDAPMGATRVKLAGAQGFTKGRTGLSGLTDYWAAEVLLKLIDPATGECTLSKPLPKALKAGKVPMATLKYLPLCPPGTPEFEETVGGWTRYAMRVGSLSLEAGIDDFDFELYNELTFGTKFLDIRNYWPDRPKPPNDPLHEGGTLWELGRKVTEGVKKEFPKCRVIWGFSNTTFFHTSVEQLPPRVDGQSYHPYGTGTRRLPEQEYHREQTKENLEGWTPQIEVRLPEGIASSFIQTECILRLLEPKAKSRHPKDVGRFYHYMTEHGVLAKECGVEDVPGAWALKAKCALRTFSFWLAKGIDVIHFYAAYYKEPGEFGLLPVDLPKLPADARFEDVATPPLRAIRNLTGLFSGHSPATLAPLEVEVTSLGEQRKIFDGARPLWHREVFAAFPWQLGEATHAIVLYVMTWDGVPNIPEERYRLIIHGTSARKAILQDPLIGREIPIKMLRCENGLVEVEVAAVDTPRILLLSP